MAEMERFIVGEKGPEMIDQEIIDKIRSDLRGWSEGTGPGAFQMIEFSNELVSQLKDWSGPVQIRIVNGQLEVRTHTCPAFDCRNE